MNITLPDIIRRFGDDDPSGRTRALRFAEERRYYPRIDLELRTYASFMDGIFEDLETLAEALKDYDEMLGDLVDEEEDDELIEVTGNLSRQANLMKTLLARRAESSPRALVRTLERIIELVDNRDLVDIEKKRLRELIEPILATARKIAQDPSADEKATDLLRLLQKRRKDKALIFSEYRDTATYLSERLAATLPSRRIDLLTGDASKATRRRAMRSFAPSAQGSRERGNTDILIGTDAISEGENLEEAQIVINYDLPWTPLRLVQRLGRTDRPTEQPRKVLAYNYFPRSERYRDMISHWERLEGRASQVKEVSDAEVLRSTRRDPHSFRGDATHLYFDTLSTYDDLVESVKDRQLPTSAYLRVQMAAAPDEQREAESLPAGVWTARTGTKPGLYLLLEIEGRFVCLAHPLGAMFAEEIDRLVFLRALESQPDTPLATVPDDMEQRVERALGQWAKQISATEAEQAQLQIALWVVEQ